MRFASIASLLLAAGLTLATSAHADTLAYPTSDAASFVVDYPSSREMTPGEAVGDYLDLSKPGRYWIRFAALELCDWTRRRSVR